LTYSNIPWKVLAAIDVHNQPAKEGKETLQMADPAVAEIIRFLEDGITPENDYKAREVTLTMAQYEVIDGVLYLIRPFKLFFLQLTERRFSKKLIVVYLVPTYRK